VGIRTETQSRVTELLQGGTFYKVTYDSSTDLPTESDEILAPTSVIMNEISGGLSDSVKHGATGTGFVIRDWRFEVVAEFTSEVSCDYFLMNELRKLNFNVDNQLISVVPSGDFQAKHPPRQASHNGTKLTIGLTVNTRR
jgi:hypothetical protein